MKTQLLFTVVLVVLILIGAGIYIDSRTNQVNVSPPNISNPAKSNVAATESANPSEKIDFKNYGPAPDFVGIEKWLNSEPLTMKSLRGKVVLIDFWTYSCINCIRTLPYVTRWYDTYKDKGFVVVGVHTPEFAFEKDTNNVREAIAHFNIHYPVAQDNEYKTWIAYNNEFWPAEYLIDKNGDIVHLHIGEGEYDVTENAIRALLGLNATAGKAISYDLGGIQSPEMYFGTDRLRNLTPEQATSSSPKNYAFPKELVLNNFALEGNWQFSPDNIKLASGRGKIKLKFHAGKVHLVASSPIPAKLMIVVDGKTQPAVTVSSSQLYTLFNSSDYSDHIIEISLDTPGFEAFTFTFG